MKKIALSGADGHLGSLLRKALPERGFQVRAAGYAALPPLEGDTKAPVSGDLRDAVVVDQLLVGMDVLIHMAGTSIEKPLNEIIDNNLQALYQVYEGARRNKVRRVVFASSNHAIGMYPVEQRLDIDCEFRPDGFYGLSKMWGEGMARLYWDKHGIESVCIRIGSCLARPQEARHLATWLSYGDFIHLIEQSVSVPNLGYQVVWGVSANTRNYWNNEKAASLGYRPTDNAEDFAAEIATLVAADPVTRAYQGGGFASQDFTPMQHRPQPA